MTAESVPSLTLIADPVSVMAFAIPWLEMKFIVVRGEPIGVPLLSTVMAPPPEPVAEIVQSVLDDPELSAQTTVALVPLIRFRLGRTV